MSRTSVKPSVALAAAIQVTDGAGPAPRAENSSANAERLFAPERIPAAVEAMILTSDRPLGATKIAQALGLMAQGDGAKTVKDAVEALNLAYEREGRSFRIELVAGGYRVMTLAEFAPAIHALRGARESARLSRAGVETLAIIAYRQPIGRAEIEAIRGVACGEVLRTLLERRLIDIVGRAEELGRPMLYGTTKAFLEAFRLGSLKDLPNVGELFPEVAGALEKQARKSMIATAPPGNEPVAGEVKPSAALSEPTDA